MRAQVCYHRRMKIRVRDIPHAGKEDSFHAGI